MSTTDTNKAKAVDLEAIGRAAKTIRVFSPCGMESPTAYELEAFGAAVVELIEKATAMRKAQNDYIADPIRQRSEEKGWLIAVAIDEFDAALANIQGGAA